MRVTIHLADQLVDISNLHQFINLTRDIAEEYLEQHPEPQGCINRLLSQHLNHGRARRIITQANALLVEGKKRTPHEINRFIHAVMTETGSGSLNSLMQLAIRNFFNVCPQFHENYFNFAAPNVHSDEPKQSEDIAFSAPEHFGR